MKGNEEYLYSAFLHQGAHNALRHGSHSFTCKQHHACLGADPRIKERAEADGERGARVYNEGLELEHQRVRGAEPLVRVSGRA